MKNSLDQKISLSSIGPFIRYVLLLTVVVGIRAFPRIPNVEPVMASALPVAKRHGALASAVFAFSAMLAADTLMGQMGWWSLYTAVPYGLIGYAAGLLLTSKSGRLKMTAFAVVGTLVFDVITMVAFAIQFGTPLPIAAAAQVPFTLLHLAGNVVLVLVVSPLLTRFVLSQPNVQNLKTKSYSVTAHTQN